MSSRSSLARSLGRSITAGSSAHHSPMDALSFMLEERQQDPLTAVGDHLSSNPSVYQSSISISGSIASRNSAMRTMLQTTTYTEAMDFGSETNNRRDLSPSDDSQRSNVPAVMHRRVLPGIHGSPSFFRVSADGNTAMGILFPAHFNRWRCLQFGLMLGAMIGAAVAAGMATVMS